MDNDLKLEIIIKTKNNDERFRIGNSIHEQLVGNKDYIDNNIILNIDTDCTVHIWIFKECENIPHVIDELIKTSSHCNEVRVLFDERDNSRGIH